MTELLLNIYLTVDSVVNRKKWEKSPMSQFAIFKQLISFKIIELNSVSLFFQEQHAPILVFYSYFEYRNSLDIHLYRLV